MKYILFLLLITTSATAQGQSELYRAYLPLKIDTVSITPPVFNLRVLPATNTQDGYIPAASFAKIGLHDNSILQIQATQNTQAADITKAKSDIAALQAGSGSIPIPIVTTGNYTLTLADYDKTIFVNCSGCTVSMPPLVAGFRCFIVRDGNGTPNVRSTGGVTQTGATAVAVKNGGGQWVTYKTATRVNVQIR